MMEDPDTVPLLISLRKHADATAQLTAAKTLAELAEEPKNRVRRGASSGSSVTTAPSCGVPSRPAMRDGRPCRPIVTHPPRPRRQVNLVRLGILPSIFALMRQKDSDLQARITYPSRAPPVAAPLRGSVTYDVPGNGPQFQCARAMADLAEAIDNRIAIVYGGLDSMIALVRLEQFRAV
jgi:hypothetical protein